METTEENVPGSPMNRAKQRVKEGLQEWIGKIERELDRNVQRMRDIESEQRILKRQKQEIASILKDRTIL